MPEIHSETPRDKFTIASKEFEVYKPYSEGHPLSAGEASAMNQVFSENLRNNFAKKVKEANEAGTFDQETFQELLDKYATEYEFGVRTSSGGTRAPADPVEARALNLAKTAVRNKIKEAGHSLKDFSAEAISERAKKAVESNPKFRELAAAQIAEESSIDVGEVDSTGDGGTKRKAKAKADA